ncbi:mucin-17-like isoform X2 [Penaeus monodon]|uniref:mucin-17-like isoform X2 n=1 Tax=Penaeus monodon TaxID=6687 RepID=UPI0018A7888C|nr:mucin-17-like isoform X2 [Penaeus monodon]
MTSEVTSTAGKESPHRQRTRSSCSEVTGPCPDTLETGRLESAPSDMVNDINVKSLSEVVCDVHQNISECDSLCSLETMQDSTGTHITSEDTSFFLNDVKGSHSISSSATPIVSASGTPIKNITDSVSSPITRRSSRLLASEVLEKSKTRRQSLPSGALSDAAVTTKSLATRVLTRNARRKSFSDTEVHSQQAHQQKLDVTGSPKVTEKIESNIAEIMKDTDGELDSDNLSLGLDGNFSSSSLSCSLLQIEEEPLAECDNNNEKQIQAVVNDLRIYDLNADATSESQTQEKEQKVVLANQVNASAEHLQEGTDATESDIMCRASDSENQVKLGETESMEVICDQLIKGGALEDHHEVEACLPEDVDEELEVLSTSGVDDTEDLSYGLSSSFTLNKDEDSENPETQMTTPKSFTRLRSLSQRRSGGKGSKKDDRVNDLKFDSPHLSSPKVKAQLVSEAVLNKEVLISPEVSDEECELVSPGGDETDLPKDNFTLSGGSDPLTPVNRRNKRRSGGGIRSPQKMIPEEQDETTTHIASVRGSPASKTLRIQKPKMFSTKSPKIVAENSEGSADITVSEQQKSANTETENKKSSVKSALEEPLEEIISNKAPILETPATTPSPRRNSGKGSQAAPDVDAESDTSVVKESSEVASVSKQETDLNLDSENKFSPVKTRRNRRSSLAIMTTEVKLTDNDKISKIKYCSPEQQNENAEKNLKEDSTPVYRTRRSMTLKKQDLKQELLSAPFSPRRSSRRKSVASNSSESTGSIEVVPLRSRRSSTASSSEDKHPQIPEEPACPKKSALKNAPVGLASPRTKSDRTSLLKSDPMGKCSPRNSSPARATRSSSGYTEAPTNLPAKSGTPVRTSSRLASRKESHTDSSCENGSSSETSSKGGNTGRSSLKKMSSDVPSTSSDMAAGQLNVSAKVDSELLTASVTEIKSPTRSSTFKSSQDKKVASSSSGNESPARSLSPSVSKTPVRSASLPLVTKTPTRSSPLNSANKALSSPTNKRSLRSPSVNKTPVRSPMTNTPARSPGRPPSVNKSLMRSPAANTISVKSPSSIKSPLTSPTVSKTQVTLASASETSMTSPIRVSRRSLSSDRSPLASPSVSRTHTRSSSISKSPGRPPAEKGLPKHSPKKSSSPFRAADSNSKGSAKDRC